MLLVPKVLEKFLLVPKVLEKSLLVPKVLEKTKHRKNSQKKVYLNVGLKTVGTFIIIGVYINLSPIVLSLKIPDYLKEV